MTELLVKIFFYILLFGFIAFLIKYARKKDEEKKKLIRKFAQEGDWDNYHKAEEGNFTPFFVRNELGFIFAVLLMFAFLVVVFKLLGMDAF